MIAPHDCYGGTHRLLRARQARGQFEVDFVDLNDRSALEQALARKPKLVLIETPSNPLMRLTDIAEVCGRARAAGARTAVDNTFLSPALQQPIALGADYVIHSTTKYINGHSDVVGGAVVCAHKEDAERLTWWANCTGVTGSPFDAYMTLRGARTLFARVERQQKTAQLIAEALAAHPAVGAVHYPGLASHPGHLLARRQQKGFGAMLSFEVAGGIDEVRAVVDRLKVFTLAESLGGVESLIAHPATMTHASMDAEARAVAGIRDTLLQGLGRPGARGRPAGRPRAGARCDHRRRGGRAGIGPARGRLLITPRRAPGSPPPRRGSGGRRRRRPGRHGAGRRASRRRVRRRRQGRAGSARCPRG